MLLALPMPGAGPPASLFLGASIAAAAAGFLWWNWHPAKVFLGDVGSVPLGFLLGWLLLGLAAAGDWAAALILPLYYLADATIPLRSEEHTSELQSLMRISYAVFCLKKK